MYCHPILDAFCVSKFDARVVVQLMRADACEGAAVLRSTGLQPRLHENIVQLDASERAAPEMRPALCVS